MVVGGVGFSMFFLIGIGALVLGIYTVVDAAKYPEWAFQRAGSSRTLWIVLPIVFILFCGIGALVMGLVWLTSKRQQLEAAMIAAGHPSPRAQQPPWVGPPTDGPPPASPSPPPPPPSSGPPPMPPPYRPPGQ